MATGGLLGIRGSGRTEAFNLLAAGGGFAALRAGRFLAHAAILAPADKRLGEVARICGSAKLTPADYTIVDYAAVGLGEAGGREAEWLNVVRTLDMLLVVIPLFLDGNRIEALRPRLNDASAELVVADLLLVESRLQHIDQELKRAPRAVRPELEHERQVHESLRERLNAGGHLRGAPFAQQEARRLSGFGFLTLKPVVILINTDENGAANWEQMTRTAGELWAYPHTGAAALAAKFEAEARELEPPDRAEILISAGISDGALERVSGAVWDALGTFTVYTGNATQAQAWKVPSTTTAHDFAGSVHSDIAKGFISAETIAFDELVAAGSYAEARRRGLVRREGRDYKVADGDVIEVLFSR